MELQAIEAAMASTAAASALGGIRQAGAQAATPVGATFSELVSNGLQQVNTQLVSSEAALQQLAVGDAQSLHQVMVQMEESRLSFQLLMQVRNRLLEAYQDVMKMQI